MRRNPGLPCGSGLRRSPIPIALGRVGCQFAATLRYAALPRKLYKCATEISARCAYLSLPNCSCSRFRTCSVAGPLSQPWARSTSANSATSRLVYFVAKLRRAYAATSTTPPCRYWRINRVICGSLNPVTLFRYARMVPRSFLPCTANSWATSTRCTNSYRSVRFCPANSIGRLPLRNSWICSWVSISAFCMRICIRPQTASPSHIFMIILYWNQVRFHDHLVLENSQVGIDRPLGQDDIGLFRRDQAPKRCGGWRVHHRGAVDLPGE